MISTIATPMLYAGAAGLILGWAMVPLLRSMKTGQQVREDGPASHLTKAGTPTFGGLIIILAVLVAVIGVRAVSARALLVLAGMTVFAVIGFVDDYVKSAHKTPTGWKARYKFLVELLFGVALALWALHLGHVTEGLGPSCVVVPWRAEPWDLGWAYVPVSALLIVGMANAVNLTDGLDGLAAGSGAIVAMATALVCFLATDFAVVPVAAALAGACLVFLWFNGHPAQVFMGDTGALAIGGVLGTIAVASGLHIIVMIAGGLFCWEALSVILQVASYKTSGRRIFRMAPYHHHLELLNWPETKVVSRLWVVAFLFAVLAVTSFQIAP